MKEGAGSNDRSPPWRRLLSAESSTLGPEAQVLIGLILGPVLVVAFGNLPPLGWSGQGQAVGTFGVFLAVALGLVLTTRFRLLGAVLVGWVCVLLVVGIAIVVVAGGSTGGA